MLHRPDEESHVAEGPSNLELCFSNILTPIVSFNMPERKAR